MVAMIPEDASLKEAFGPFRRGHEPPLVRPFRVAAILAVVYIVLCAVYISVSSRIAARTSGSLHDLEQLEVLKGTLFVVVTGMGLFFLAWTLLRRIAKQEMRLARQRAQLVAWERRAAAATFAASAAHDINNVLTVAGGHVHRIAGAHALGPREKESTKRLESAILEISKLADDLLRLGRLGAGGHVESVDLRHVVEQSVEFARTHRRVRHCELVLDAATSPRVHVDASAVVQCVLNLIINAADAAGAGGHIAVRVSQRGQEAVVEVHDDGPGVPDAQREKIFEAFHTTKEAGSGLGLVSVKVCAEQHGGRVEVGTSDLGGACFRVVLPVEKPASPPGDRPAPEAAASV